ncbi:hypothetical protein D3C85_1417690 [compost metagenome]
MGKPSLLLPAIKTGRALAQLGDQRFIEFFFSVQANAVFIDKSCAEALVSAAIGNAPGADAGFVIFDGVYRPHIDVAASLFAADAGVCGGLYRAAGNRVRVVGERWQIHWKVLDPKSCPEPEALAYIAVFFLELEGNGVTTVRLRMGVMVQNALDLHRYLTRPRVAPART